MRISHYNDICMKEFKGYRYSTSVYHQTSPISVTYISVTPAVMDRTAEVFKTELVGIENRKIINNVAPDQSGATTHDI